MTFIDELRLVTKRHVIVENLLRSTHPVATGARDEIDRMWNWYHQLAEADFPLRFATDPQSKYWEMYLAFALKDVGFQVRREKDGPDFWIDGKDGRIWIEAIAPEPGDSTKPDCVPEPLVNQVSDTPVRQIVLRLTSAIRDKQQKFKRYQRDGIVAENDSCVIPLSAASFGIPSQQIMCSAQSMRPATFMSRLTAPHLRRWNKEGDMSLKSPSATSRRSTSHHSWTSIAAISARYSLEDEVSAICLRSSAVTWPYFTMTWQLILFCVGGCIGVLNTGLSVMMNSSI